MANATRSSEQRATGRSSTTSDRPHSTAADSTKSEPWGRRTRASIFNSFFVGMMVICCPIWVIVNDIALEHFQGSFTAALLVTLCLPSSVPRPPLSAVRHSVKLTLLPFLLYSPLHHSFCSLPPSDAYLRFFLGVPPSPSGLSFILVRIYWSPYSPSHRHTLPLPGSLLSLHPFRVIPPTFLSPLSDGRSPP